VCAAHIVTVWTSRLRDLRRGLGPGLLFFRNPWSAYCNRCLSAIFWFWIVHCAHIPPPLETSAGSCMWGVRTYGRSVSSVHRNATSFFLSIFGTGMRPPLYDTLPITPTPRQESLRQIDHDFQPNAVFLPARSLCKNPTRSWSHPHANQSAI